MTKDHFIDIFRFVWTTNRAHTLLTECWKQHSNWRMYMSEQSDIQSVLVIEGNHAVAVQDQLHVLRDFRSASVTLTDTFAEGLERATTRQYDAIVIGSKTLTDGRDPEEMLHELVRLKNDDGSDHPSQGTLMFFHHDGGGKLETFEATSEGSMFYCVLRDHPGLLTEALWKAGLQLKDSQKPLLRKELESYRARERAKKSQAA